MTAIIEEGRLQIHRALAFDLLECDTTVERVSLMNEDQWFGSRDRLAGFSQAVPADKVPPRQENEDRCAAFDVLLQVGDVRKVMHICQVQES